MDWHQSSSRTLRSTVLEDTSLIVLERGQLELFRKCIVCPLMSGRAVAGDRPSEGNRLKPVPGFSVTFSRVSPGRPSPTPEEQPWTRPLPWPWPVPACSSMVLPAGSRVQAAQDFPSYQHRFSLCSPSGLPAGALLTGASSLRVPFLGKSLRCASWGLRALPGAMLSLPRGQLNTPALLYPTQQMVW